MGQEEALLQARAFSWEHEQGVLEPVSAPPAMDHAGGGTPQSPRKTTTDVAFSWEHDPAVTKPVSTPAVKPSGVPEKARKAQAPTRRLSVPPPPGRAAPRAVSRAVRPEDDPFLAAYLACTKSTGGGGDGGKKRTTGAREPKGRQGHRRFAWAGLGLGLGGLSCKRGEGAVEQSMVRLAKLPDLDPRDA